VETLASDLEQRFPEDTFVQFTYLLVLRGLAERRRGKPEPSAELLQDALFERRWALSVLDRVVERLRAEFVDVDASTTSTG
jgi:hypothetical protein